MLGNLFPRKEDGSVPVHHMDADSMSRLHHKDSIKD